MLKLIRRLLLGSLAVGATALAADPAHWVEGQHYFRLRSPQPTDLPAGKVEVIEVFSYGCPACNAFAPYLRAYRAKLPSNVVLRYVPANWNSTEQWPLFQRAYLTASALGIADKAHDAMYDAIWKTGELAVVDESSGRVRANPPTMQDIAKFYQKVTGYSADEFVKASTSFSVETAIRRANAQVMAFEADQTPTLIVDRRFRITPSSAGGSNAAIQLLGWLVAQESGTGSAAKR